MRLGIMQPYFFPYIGYFALIANTDKWVVLDITQYTPRTWMNRNRILHPKENWQYITVPLDMASRSNKIQEVRILEPLKCRNKILSQIGHYKKKAPYYHKVFNLIKSISITVEKGGSSHPYLRSIGEKAELISLLYQQRQKDTQETLDDLKELVEEINKAKKEQAEKQMPTEVFSAYWVLKKENILNPEEKSHQMIPIFEKYPYWKTSEEHKRHFKRELLKIFTTAQMNAKQSIELVNKIITILKGDNT